jgi:hypothetical protein
MNLGLISSFAIHYFPDTYKFCIPADKKPTCFTPEEAYCHLKKIIKQSNKSA